MRERVVQPSPAGDDLSCLARHGGTLVAAELSDRDVRKIEALIRQSHSLPIMAIHHPGFLGERPDSKGADFEVMTGVGCGPLSGHGGMFRLTRVDGEWIITERGSWVS